MDTDYLIKEKMKQNLKNKKLLYNLCKIITKGEDFPELQMLDMKKSAIKMVIEAKCIKDKELCKKAISIYSQIEMILENFAQENNIDYEKLD